MKPRGGRSFTGTFLLIVWYLLPGPVTFAQGPAELPQPAVTQVADGLVQPVHITNAGDNSARLFVVEQPGRIRTIRNGALAGTPFLDISGRVSCCGERGLLSVAFPPGYGQKNYFYVDYTNLSGDTVVSRFRLSADPDIADPNSEEILLTVSQPFANHNGGQLVFGPDGFLYIGMGDGGSGCDPNSYAQNLTDLPGNRKLLGKLLRIDVESGVRPYAVPQGNPLFNGSRSEIWAYGLRNPWRFSFDRLTGDLYIGDVGQSSFEEIDFQPASSPGGENYGWHIMEGFHCSNFSSCPGIPCNQAGLTLPVFEYGHDQGCSVTGGMVYRGPNYPRMYGMYFYSDYCSGRIWGLKRVGTVWQNSLLLSTGLNVTTFGEDERGTLFLSDYSGGRILKLTDSFSVMSAPAGQETFSYAPSFVPEVDADPALAKPVGVGSIVLGVGGVGLQIALPQFDGPVDIYIAVFAPSVDPRLFLLRPDNTFQPASVGLVPWKTSAGPVSEPLFGTIPATSFPSGIYTLYLAVTPPGRIDTYYLWKTFFAIP